MAKALSNCCAKVFHFDESSGVEKICDKVRSHWLKNRLVDIPRENYMREQSNEPRKLGQASSSY